MPVQSLFCPARRWLLWVALASLVSCGGVDSGGTGSVAYGPVNGLGSIIVNGVRFDDSRASISDEDGQPVARERLQLGVMTSVEGTEIVSTGGERRATASRVRVLSEMIGPIGAIAASTETIEVLGQTVRITPATVFDDGLPMGLASLQVGSVVEVFGRLDVATGVYAATRIEQRPGATSYVLRGRIDGVDAGRTFSVGALVVDFSQLSAREVANVVVGSIVRVRLALSPAGGVWRALSVVSGQRSIGDGEEASIEGRISTFDSLQSFRVDSVRVDATMATFPDGVDAIELGARVSVEGSAEDGVIHARVVRVEGDEDSSNSTFEVHGTIDALDAAAKVLTVRGVSVDYSGTVRFEEGTIDDLRVGRSIEVEGVLRADGVGLIASKISFER